MCCLESERNRVRRKNVGKGGEGRGEGTDGGSIPEASQRKVTALVMCLQLVREGWSQYCTSVNRVGRCETENC